MKKEYWLFVAIGLLVLALVIDSVSGPINLPIKNQLEYFDPTIMQKYPLTTVGIFFRSLGIIVGYGLLWSLFERLYGIKLIATFLLTGLMELFVVQQLATGMRTVNFQWIMAIAVAGAGFGLPLVYYFVRLLIPSPRVQVVVDENSKSVL
ncbi:hypothetical protein KBC75_00500 [Candidatus Shapirobacteria bacterium]|nr:hypothetical protein [Candidatus Shapirobacteria bacterium]